jgi:rhodanese-related sulfurtransferase
MKQHSSRFLTLIEHVKPLINEITPQELKARLESEKPVYLIDVREDNELASGRIPGAIHLSKGIIERDIEKQITDPETPIVVYCSGGFRCALVAENLQRMGYKQVASLNTGLQGWINAGYSLE